MLIILEIQERIGDQFLKGQYLIEIEVVIEEDHIVEVEVEVEIIEDDHIVEVEEVEVVHVVNHHLKDEEDVPDHLLLHHHLHHLHHHQDQDQVDKFL